MTALTDDEIFDAAIQIMLFIDRSITIHFSKNTIQIRFPTTRKLAEHLQIPHYYVLPYFATMEKDNLIIRVERVGISTTQAGSRKLIELMATKYKEKTESVIGTALFEEIQKRVMIEDRTRDLTLPESNSE
jgi:DNA-binding transcriptional regulator YhcF (GntR family)